MWWMLGAFITALMLMWAPSVVEFIKWFKLPPHVASVNRIFRPTRNDLRKRFPNDFAQIYPHVPLEAEWIPTRTTVCIALKGQLAEKVPPIWQHRTSPLFTALEQERLDGMAEIVRSHLQDIGVTPSIQFDSQKRIGHDPYTYFQK